MPEQSKQDQFVRQRRNIIITSLVVLIYHFADLKITELNILGNKTEIGNPQSVYQALILIFFYFLWRYYTVCNEIFGIGAFLNECQDASYKSEYRHAIKIVENSTGIKSPNFSLNAQKHEKSSKRFNRNYFVINLFNSNLSDELKDKLNSMKAIQIEGWAFYKLAILSYLGCILHKNPFSEYVLPYLIALVAFLFILLSL